LYLTRSAVKLIHAALQKRPLYPLATSEDGEKKRNELESTYHDLTARNDEAARFAFDESKAAYDLSRERFKSLDGKAVTFTGIIIAGLGAIAVLGDPSKIQAHGWWLYVGLGALCFALAASLLSLAPGKLTTPDLSPYVWPATFANADNLARVRIELARAWLRDNVSLERANAGKGRCLNWASFLVVVGLAALIGNSLAVSVEDRAAPTMRVIVASPAPAPVPRTSQRINKESR